MNDPYLSVAIQFSLALGAGSIVLWYVLVAASAAIWNIVALSYAGASKLAGYYRLQHRLAASTTVVKPAIAGTHHRIAFK